MMPSCFIHELLSGLQIIQKADPATQKVFLFYDELLIEKNFPPSEEQIQSLKKLGWDIDESGHYFCFKF